MSVYLSVSVSVGGGAKRQMKTHTAPPLKLRKFAHDKLALFGRLDPKRKGSGNSYCFSGAQTFQIVCALEVLLKFSTNIPLPCFVWN